MHKKILTVILALIMALSITTPAAYAGVAPTGDPLQDNSSMVDIFINADVASGINPETIKTMLATKLNGGLKQFPSSSKTLTADDIRINTNVVSIDMSDMSKWVVYDHYGSNNGATYANSNQTGIVDAPASWINTFGASTVKRPYFAYYEYSSTNPTVYSIANYLALPVSSQQYVAPLDQHIYALKDSSDNYSMTFVGYGSPAYCDFLYYPTSSAGTKQVSFSVDSQYVNTHTLTGAGFLLNSGIDNATGNISGYVLYYHFQSAASLYAIKLMKINPGVTADDLHQNGMLGSYLTEVNTYTSPAWNSKMDINLEITPTSLKVTQKPTSGTEYANIFDVKLDATSYNGFGPFTQYSGHGCSMSSQFRFTNLEMGFAADSSSILDALAKSNFLAGSEKYFVNLLNESGGSEIIADDWEGITRMREGSIRYVTNVVNPFLNDGGVVTSGAPNGSNGRTFTTYADLDELTTKIAAYILSKNSYVMPAGTITLSNPIAMFDLRAGSNESVVTVVRDFVGSGGLPIYTSDNSKPSTNATLDTYRYKITSPSGVVQTLSDRTSPASASNPLMTIALNTEVGTWTVDLVVVDTAEKTSSTSTATFQVAEAEEYTIEIKAGNHMTLDDDDINPQTVTQFSPIVNIPVTAETGYVLPAAYSIGNGLYFVRLTETTGKISGTPTDSLKATLKDARIPSTVTCALGTGSEPTPDKDKYYITVTPSDPGFEYNLMDKNGALFPASNPWTQGRETAIVFGPLALGDTYTVVARQLETEEFGYEEIDEFALESPAVDTGDTSKTNLLLLLAFGSLASAVLVARRRRQGVN